MYAASLAVALAAINPTLSSETEALTAEAPVITAARPDVDTIPPIPDDDGELDTYVSYDQWNSRRRWLWAGFGLSAAHIGAGAASIGLGAFRAARQCAGGNFCEGTPYFVGLGIGAPLMVAGTVSTLVFTGLLISHAHKRPSATAWIGKRRRVALRPSVGGITMRW